MHDHKKDENGYKGEQRSRAFLSDHFWILTRSVDADSADIIVQERMESSEDAIAKRNRSVELGYIQSKFFENKNQVRIHRSYVDDPMHPYRKGYFAFLHSNDAEDEHVHYFFSAEDIQQHWYLNSKQDHYCFSLTEVRGYEAFRNLGRKHIKQKVLAGIRELRGSIESLIWRSFIANRSDTRMLGDTAGEYILTRPHGCPTVIYKVGGEARPLEPRKDVMPTLGYFEWGYYGTGPMLLAASILTHFMAGDIPTRDEINLVKDYLIGRLERFNETDHVIDASMIICALSRIPYPASATELDARMKPAYEETLKKYEKYLSSDPEIDTDSV